MTIEQIEKMLREYEDNKRCKNILEIELECIEETGVSAIDYSLEKVSDTYKINRPVENGAIKNIKNAERNKRIQEEIKMNIKLLDSRIKIIDEALKRLKEDERKIIEKYYIENKTYDMIKREMYLSLKQIRNRRRSALEKIKNTFEMLERNKKVK
ncbi:sigma factor-like helix-turn-helix DNA-binding protein [Caloranaerobacter ferrireducens]|uniref:sigma factor-like helix-turn-helix DNA-binding protein n=1 Tax=Caloranaerobacter ferrireducens TaxID=1323370 RepID=UPI00084CF7B3|nr:sigma factor-like helix-turn-helix DNA-binding protein [Caloranaerobacter ferrireducens]